MPWLFKSLVEDSGKAILMVMSEPASWEKGNNGNNPSHKCLSLLVWFFGHVFFAHEL